MLALVTTIQVCDKQFNPAVGGTEKRWKNLSIKPAIISKNLTQMKKTAAHIFYGLSGANLS